MPAVFRPRRSLLYMPGSNPRALEKARSLPADGLIIDLEAAATMPIDAVLLPKVESPDRVRLTLSLLDALGAPEGLAVWCMIETPLGVLAAREIAAANPRLGALVLGTSDLTKELHAATTRDRLPLITALGLVMLAARAYGLAILDGVYLDVSDEEGFGLQCRQGREL